MSPLIRRIPRQLKGNLGKYLGIFLLMAFSVAFSSGYLSAESSLMQMATGMPDRYQIEDGRVTVAHELDDSQVEAAERGEFAWFDRMLLSLSHDDIDFSGYEQLSLHKLFSRDLDMTVSNDAAGTGSSITLRLFENREDIDLAAVHEGALPEKDDEIALDSTCARNHGIQVGDTVQVAGRTLKVCGLASLPDYTALLKKNNDFMMDALTFSVGVMTPEGYASFSDTAQTCTYGIVFDNPDLTRAQRTAAESKLVQVLTLSGATVTDLLDVGDNQGVNYVINDFEGDSAMYHIAFYLIVVIMAFIFVVITAATIEKESSVIGTLLASGYGKGELLRHYLVLPAVIAIAATVVGNLCKPFFVSWAISAYYGSYSLPPFEYRQDWSVFIQTSVVPVVMLMAITCLGLACKLKHSPLAFLRREISHTHRGKGVRLPERLSFFTRLRLRVILNNVGSVVTIFLGIFIAGTILVFGVGFIPVVDNYVDEAASSLPAGHVYTLKSSKELPKEDAGAASQAEKLELQSLEVPKKWNWGFAKITVYGIDENSMYWPSQASGLDTSDASAVIGGGLADKCGLSVGDSMTLHSSYKDEDYAVVVSQVTADDTDMNVYMKRACLNALVGNEKDDFNGWASDDELHFDADNVMSDLTSNDMAAIAGQIRSSMGSIMAGLVASVVVIFAIVIYLLSKTVMERSSHAMSRLKVFGYRNGELSRVYVRAITVSVVVSLLVSIPLISAACGALFDVGLMDYDIAFKLSVPWDVFAEYVLMGLVCYAVVALANRWHLSRVPLALALKGQD